MHIALTVVFFATSTWTLLSVAAIAASRVWFREREGRRGPIPVSQAAALTLPIRGLVDPIGRTVDAFACGRGQTVLEIGPGPGYFTPEAARRVGPHGRVICIELQPGMLAMQRQRLSAQSVNNADPVAADATQLPLTDASIDAAFLAAVFGEIPDRGAALAELRRVLRPGASLSFLETMRDSDYIYTDTLKDLCRAYGFTLIAHRRRFLGYTMTFSAPAAAVTQVAVEPSSAMRL